MPFRVRSEEWGVGRGDRSFSSLPTPHSSLSLGWYVNRLRVTRQGRRFGDAAVAERPQHLQYLAPGRERPAVVALVLVHRLHEQDFIFRVVALTSGRVH